MATTKFTSGAWVPLVLIPLIILLFKAIRRHYLRVDRALEANLTAGMTRPRRNTVIVLVGNVHGGVVQALSYAKSLNPNYLVAVRLVDSDEEAAEVNKVWLDAGFDIPLETVYSPYRELRRPLLEFLDRLDRITSYNVCYTKLLRNHRLIRSALWLCKIFSHQWRTTNSGIITVTLSFSYFSSRRSRNSSSGLRNSR